MKKFRKILVALVFAFMAFVGLTGCGKGDEIVGAQVVSGTIATTVAKGGTVDTSKMKAQIRYKEAETKTVDMSEMEIVQAPDTSVVGETTMKVKYNGYEFTVTIRVVATESDVNSISLLESQLLIDYEANRKITPGAKDMADQSTWRNEFFIGDSPLYVGDDNAFNFRLNAAGRDGAGKPVLDIEKVRTNISIARKEGSTFVALDEDGIETYIDEIDTEHTTIDFSDAAKGQVFQVLVEAANKDYSAEENATKFTAVLHVIDGYNVYNAADLSIYDNANRDGIWTDKKAATGMTGKTTNAIILQDNIQVTRDDVPAGYFWNAQTQGELAGYQVRMNKLKELEQTEDDLLDGTLINDSSTAIYRRVVEDGKEFKFEGNYFQVDLSLFPKAVSEDTAATSNVKVVSKKDGQAVTGYFSTFYNTVANPAAVSAGTGLKIQNVRFYGNGSLNNEVENSGSIIFMKNNYVNTHAYNTIQHNYYIGYFLELGKQANTGKFLIEKCKGYNSYQDLLYGYGAEEVVIKDSEFIDAGGPAIVAGYTGNVNGTDAATAHASNFYVVNSTVESNVFGTEAWFKNYHADAIVQQFSLLERLFSGEMGIAKSGKSIFAGHKDGAPVYNMIGIIYNTNMKSVTEPSYTQGSIRIFDSETEFNSFKAGGYQDGIGTYGLDTSKSIVGNAQATQSIYLESSASAGYINENVATNFDTTALGSLLNVAIYKMIAGAVEQGITAAQNAPFNLSENLAKAMFENVNVGTEATFGSKTFAEQQAELKRMLTALSQVQNLGATLVAGVYTTAKTQLAGLGVTLPETGDTAIQLAALSQVIDGATAYNTKSFSDGEQLNIYLPLGIGAMIGLTNLNA